MLQKWSICGELLDNDLALEICWDKKPELDDGTPDYYIKLAKRYMDQDKNNQPTATVIAHKIV
ncbi:15040_t:CDS:2 [Racocetra fulgida]|uniref:15040_t:CDS:1 n=1 Tax=Racocetra fulgida TaxID=60492 RepID=A0A9N8ZAV0_9GLOM|nr:15040_t:CDS:2 [Racocetra fulgida]